MKKLANALGGIIVLWLVGGLPLLVFWMIFDFDFSLYWTICIIGTLLLLFLKNSDL